MDFNDYLCSIETTLALFDNKKIKLEYDNIHNIYVIWYRTEKNILSAMCWFWEEKLNDLRICFSSDNEKIKKSLESENLSVEKYMQYSSVFELNDLLSKHVWPYLFEQ